MIKIEHLFFSYTGSAPFILQDLNLSITDGEYISVVGENGSGKSTLLKLLLKFLKPSKGSISVQTQHIGYVPQKTDDNNYGFPITVYEMLDSYRKLLKIKDKNVIEDCLSAVGLPHQEKKLMDLLSGGQRQKALIARALIGTPQLLILDEPSTGIDRESQKDIYRLLKKLNTQQGITIISVEHNLEAAISNSTSIYHVKNAHGHICTPEQYASEILDSKENFYA